jgi:hypothetical protein
MFAQLLVNPRHGEDSGEDGCQSSQGQRVPVVAEEYTARYESSRLQRFDHGGENSVEERERPLLPRQGRLGGPRSASCRLRAHRGIRTDV